MTAPCPGTPEARGSLLAPEPAVPAGALIGCARVSTPLAATAMSRLSDPRRHRRPSGLPGGRLPSYQDITGAVASQLRRKRAAISTRRHEQVIILLNLPETE